MGSLRARRLIGVIILFIFAAVPLSQAPVNVPTLQEFIDSSFSDAPVPDSLAELQVKGRAPKTGYERSQFGNGWGTLEGCDMRNRILARDLMEVVRTDDCRVQTGELLDPYTGGSIRFMRGESTSDDVQIDHVVALSNAWQTGAQQLDYNRRVEFANDPLNLLAVSGSANEQKSDGDAATWLPSNKPFRCSYVNRQIAVKGKYGLWITTAERDAIARVLASCP